MTEEMKKLSAPLPPKTSNSSTRTLQGVAKRSKDPISSKTRGKNLPITEQEADQDSKTIKTNGLRIDLPP